MPPATPYRYAAAWLSFHTVMVGVARFLLLPFEWETSLSGGPLSPLAIAGAFCSFLLWFGVSWATFRWTVHELVVKPSFVRHLRVPPEMDCLPYTEAWVMYLGLSAVLMVIGGLALTLWPSMTATRAFAPPLLACALAAMAFVMLASFLAFRWAVSTRIGPRIPPIS